MSKLKFNKKMSSNDISSDVEKLTLDVDGYFPLKMVLDKKTEMYVKFARVMVILQGPHNNRMHVADQVLKKFKYCSRVISDATYRKECRAVCDVEHTEEFYEYFRREARKALELGNTLLVIDSSMSNKEQNAYYTAIAQEMKFVVLPVPPIVTGLDKEAFPNDSQAGSFLKVGTFIQSCNQFQHLFSAWYLHDVDSLDLRNMAGYYIKDCVEDIPEFKEMFSKLDNVGIKMEMDSEIFSEILIEHYFQLTQKWQDQVYCILKCFNNQLFSMIDYFKKKEVIDNYGKMSKLMIAGFVISPDIVAARVKLSFNQKELWDMPDELFENSTPPIVPPSDLFSKLKSQLPEVEISKVGTKSKQSLVDSGRTTCNPTENIPMHIKGRACHFVLARGPNAKSSNDFDVQFALGRLKKLHQHDQQITPYNLDRSVVRKVGKYWIIDLKEMLSVEAFFSSCARPFPYENTIGSLSSED